METWFVLDDGSFADPGEIVSGDKGLLRHKDGRRVAYTEHGPRSRSVDPEEERKAHAAKKAAARPAAEEKDMKPEEPKRAYQTRDVRGR